MANTALIWSIERADRELRKQVTEGESIAAFAPSELRTAEGREHIWRDYNHTMLLSMFADDSIASEYLKESRLFKSSYSFERIDWENYQTVRRKSEHDPVADMRLQLSKQIRCLESILSRLPLFPSGAAPALPNAQDSYCAPDRIDQIRSLRSDAFDFAKLSRLCVELNVAWSSECYYAVAALTRAVLDHVPPVFGAESFEQVANNYNGSKSFKDSMKQLQQIKAIADGFLHGQIRKKEKLPARTQVDFRPSMDVLLAEIVRITPGA
jgi:hypothetical protein